MTLSQKSQLPNGIRVITENHPKSSAVHIGFWVQTGSRDETQELAGISHLVEHLVFKGTKKRSAYEIAFALESVGGDLNAFTTKEYTCYQTLSLKEHLHLSLDVLADLVFSPTFPVKEFKKEKDVVLQEISMSKEEYSEYIYDLYLESCFPKKSIGHPILGNEKSVSETTRQDLIRYHKERYCAENTIITVVGPVDHNEIVDKLSGLLKRVPQRKNKIVRRKPKLKKIESQVNCPSEQAHGLMVFETASYKNPMRYESYFVSTLLGGGMTSRLYQTVREKNGLAYSVYSYLYTFIDTALSCVYFATDMNKMEKAKDLVLREMHKLKSKGISKKDLNLYRTQMKGNLLLGIDDLDGRMTTLAHNEMVFGRQRSLQEVIDDIESVSIDSVAAYLEKYLNLDNVGFMALGDFKSVVKE